MYGGYVENEADRGVDNMDMVDCIIIINYGDDQYYQCDMQLNGDDYM